ncbi:hypothetical protein [Psychrobacter sp. ANT_WB68]|uniref:hypothetical protein n=1 Tax=Psychrobacter sp. ANT_WB68 TaxID=2597355 RepID=UPI0011F35F05|nr:hypothetical protein [Psychrobacter sp. ANT_WB68]KAA0915574.1 hypothetical protein FQ084_03240 [Psychrobacter sp. ANT_WB68]
MTLDRELQILIPDTKDVYTDDVKAFFLTVASLVSSHFMSIIMEVEKPIILTSQHLNKILDSYQGKLTKPEYLTRAFIASTCYLPVIDMDNPSAEWLWVAKLCQLQIYFVQNDLPGRIRETTTEARKWIDPANYNHNLWEFCYLELQAETLEGMYHNFEDHRLKLESKNDPKLKAFIKIYRTIDYAHNNKSKITRSSSGRKQIRKSKLDEPKTEYIAQSDIDDDTDELVDVFHFSRIEDDVDINRERLDDPVPDFIFIKQNTIKATEKYSSNQIYRRTRAKFAHANKNERFISNNIRNLPLSTIQNICSKLWQEFNIFDNEEPNREKKRAIAYLLLSLYTGYSVTRLAEDIDNNEKKIIDISTRKKRYDFIIHLDITPLRIKTTGIESVIANQLTQFKLPLPESLGIFLTYKGHPDTLLINEVIAGLKSELELPLLSLGRIEKSLYTVIVHEVSTTQLASIITSRNNKKRADLWYSSHSLKDVKDVYYKAIKIMTDRCQNNSLTVNDHLLEVGLSDDAIGSQNCPDYPIVSLFINHLRQKIVTTTNYIEKFNLYNLWLWHISLLLTSIRAVEGAPGKLNQIHLGIGLAWISDKEERVNAESQRLVPVCAFLVAAVQQFLDYLQQFVKKFGRLNPKLKLEIDKVFISERPLLNYIDKKGVFQSLRPAIINRELGDNFRFKADWTRHVGQRFLHEQGVDEAVILAIFGHEMMGQEAWRKNSSLSIGDIILHQDDYELLAIKLALKQVNL